jgi:hypothetical protein
MLEQWHEFGGLVGTAAAALVACYSWRHRSVRDRCRARVAARCVWTNA